MEIRLPPRLREGDRVAIVSPASPISMESLQNGLRVLERIGVQIVFGEHLLDARDHLAGLDRDRAADLVAAWNDESVRAVICSRGGYGSARLLPYLDLEAMSRSPKLFVGFSDITTLHLGFNRCGLVTIHGPMPITFSVERPAWVVENFLRTLTEPRWSLPAGAPKPQTITGGVAEGRLLGGCLVLLCDAIGTNVMPDLEGTILLLEDVDEPPHRVDAMLTHLRNAGVLQKVAGIVVGEMTRTDERRDKGIGGPPWREIVQEHLSGLGVPAILDFPAGHAKAMATLPLGIRYRLDASMGRLEALEDHLE